MSTNNLLSYPTLSYKINTIPEGALIAVDTETTGLNPYKGDKAFLFSFANEDGDISVVERLPETEDMLREFFADKSITKIFHNSKFDMKMSREAGFPVRGKVHDTLTMSRLVNENEMMHNLKYLCKKYFDYKAIEDDQVDAFKKKHQPDSYLEIPKEILFPYAAVDAWNCMLLYNLFEEPISHMRKAYALDMNCTRYSMQVEDRGQLIDKKRAKELAKEFKEEALLLQKEVKVASGAVIEPSDKRTLCFALFSAGAVCKKFTKNKKTKQFTIIPDTSEAALKLYTEIEWMPTFIAFKKKKALEKTLREQLIANLDGNNVIHTNFNISLARTRRASSSQINLQNIEKKSKIREAFITRKGFTTFYFDYSQIEYRIFAHEARDDELISGYCDGTLDAHSLTSRRLDISRDESKTVNFLILYGGGADALSEKRGQPYAYCQDLLERFKDSTPGLKDMEERLLMELAENGHIEDQFGMHYHVLPEDHFKIVNTKIQGTAGSVLKHAKLNVKKLLRSTQSHMIGEIHDELIIEIADCDLPFIPTLIKESMERMPEGYFDVPMVVDVEYTKTNWAEKKEYPIMELEKGALPW